LLGGHGPRGNGPVASFGGSRRRPGGTQRPAYAVPASVRRPRGTGRASCRMHRRRA
jgi:hypothetical protein